jgi:hypothetical protein
MNKKSRWMRWVITLSADPALPLPRAVRPSHQRRRAADWPTRPEAVQRTRPLTAANMASGPR